MIDRREEGSGSRVDMVEIRGERLVQSPSRRECFIVEEGSLLPLGESEGEQVKREERLGAV